MKYNRRLRPRRNWRLLRRRILQATRPVIYAVAVGGLLLALNHALSAETIRVHADDTSLAQAVEHHIARMQPLDFWHARPALVRAKLLAAIPDLAEVRILRVLPNTLHIRPIRRRQLALWQGAGGQIWLVDAKAEAYRPMRAGDNADLPLLRCNREQLPAAVAIVLTLQEEDPQRAKALSECIALADGWQLNFNRFQRWLLPDHASAQLPRVVALLKGKRWQTGLWRVDARMSSRWFIRHAIQRGMI